MCLGNIWVTEFTVRKSQLPFDYKYAVLNSKTKEEKWEPRASNRTFTSAEDKELLESWGI